VVRKVTRPRDIEVEITFLPTEHGGRSGPAFSGYRPQFHYAGHDWVAVHEYPDVAQVHPGETARAYLSFLSPEAQVGRVKPGMPFLLREGQRVIGYGVVLRIFTLTSRPQIMIFGTHHMDNPNLDYIKTNYADVLAEPRQQQVKDLVKRLEAFAPTHVALEVLPERTERLNERYRQYLAGAYTLTRNEVDQVGLRLARTMGHSEVHCIDHHQDLDFDGVFQYVAEHGLTELKAEIEALLAELQATQQRLEAEESIIDLLRYFNSPEHDDLHQIYLRPALVGAGDNWIGAEMTANWYARNLKMYANILRLAQRPEDRIFVLVGAGHGALLREFLRQTPQVDLVDPASYLA
jgi:hypothetical protein